MKKQLLTLVFSMFLSGFLMAQSWEEVTIINGDFTLTADSSGYSGSTLNTDTVPGWFYDGPEANKISRAFVDKAGTDHKDYMAVLGFDGNGNGGGVLYNIIDAQYETETQYKLSYDVRCSWSAKDDSSYAMAYISYLSDDDIRVKIDSTHYTLLPGKDAEFTRKELMVDMADHTDAIGKDIVLEFLVDSMSFKGGEMTTPTKASWCQVDSVVLEKSKMHSSLNNVSSLEAKVSVNQQQLQIEFPELTKGTLHIYNMGGAILFTDQINSSNYTKELNLTQGIYLVKVASQNSSYMTKIFVN